MSYGSENPYDAAFANYQGFAATATEDARVAFIRRTYLHLAGAIGLFVAIETAIFATVGVDTLARLTSRLMGGWNWLLVLGGFMVVSWVADSWARSDRGAPMQYLGLALYVVAESIIFLPLLTYAYMMDTRMAGESSNLIATAGLMTAITFGGLTAVVLVTKKDMSFIGRYLWWGGMMALGLIVCAIFFGLSLGMWFSVLMVGLASGYILYQTSNILHHYRTDQHVAAALALFSSVALLFWYILQLLMALRD